MKTNSNVLNMDCIEGMKQYPDKYFELAIVDPPYGIGASSPSFKPGTVKQKNGNILKVKSNTHEQKKWDNKSASSEYFEELKRVSNNQIIWGENYYSEKFIGGRIVWDKLNGDSDQMDCDIAFCSLNKRTDLVYFMWAGMFQGVYCGKNARKALMQQGNKQLNEKRIHPTQKPVALYMWLLSNYAKEGDKILDTHLGSGSSRIAAYDMGFDFTAFELDKEYFEAQEKRFYTHLSQASLFDSL